MCSLFTDECHQTGCEWSNWHVNLKLQSIFLLLYHPTSKGRKNMGFVSNPWISFGDFFFFSYMEFELSESDAREAPMGSYSSGA